MNYHEPPRDGLRGNVLFIASAKPAHVRVALQGLRASHPDSTFDVIARHEALTATNDVPGCRVIHVTGTAQGRMGLIRRLRQSGYGEVAIVEAGDTGYGALQILPLVIAIRRVFLIDENGSVIPIRANKVLVDHVANRMRKRWQAAFGCAGLTALRLLLTPIGLLILLARTLAIYHVSTKFYSFLYRLRRPTHRR